MEGGRGEKCNLFSAEGLHLNVVDKERKKKKKERREAGGRVGWVAEGGGGGVTCSMLKGCT